MAIVVMFMLVINFGCATQQQKQAVVGIQATNDSIVFVAKKAKRWCEKDKLTDEQCEKIKDMYIKIKKIDDKVIDISKRLIALNADLISDPDYNAAMDELMQAMSDLLDMAFELKLIGKE